MMGFRRVIYISKGGFLYLLRHYGIVEMRELPYPLWSFWFDRGLMDCYEDGDLLAYI